MKPIRLYKIILYTALLSMTVFFFPEPDRLAKAASPSTQPLHCELVILANSADPYYPLAEEMAAEENAPIVPTLADALACQPVFLLWVVSPANLSDAVMVEFGLAMKEYPSVVSSGLITASTIERARGLWEQRTRVRSNQYTAVNAANPAAHIEEGQIITSDAEGLAILPLTIDNFRKVLGQADYLTFTGHGSGRYLRLDEETTLNAVDVPALNGAVVSTGSCQTVRPWIEDSIALRFIDQGAGAYSGFVFSPNEGYLMGEFSGLPFQYTWPAFPIGHVIQAQNRGTLQGFAHFPFQLLLGDPRNAFQSQPPYQIVEDRLEGNRRTIKIRDVPSGLIPVRISDGAAYHFVRAVGITAAAGQDPFYNSKLQMINIQDDKFVLLDHPGGDLTLQLSLQAPWYWFLSDILLDSFDDTLIFSPQSSGDLLAAAFALIPLAWIGWQIIKKRFDAQKFRYALLFGFGAAALQAAYSFLRLDQVTITSKTVVFTPLGLVAAFLLGVCGAFIYLMARSRVGKSVGLLVITFPGWGVMIFGLLVIALFNLLFFRPAMGTDLYNYSIGLLPAGSFLLMLVLSAVILRSLNKLIQRNPHGVDR